MDFFSINKDKIDLYFPVLTLVPFVLSVIYIGNWPAPQLIALGSIRLLYLIRDRSGKASKGDVTTLLTVLVLSSVSFILTTKPVGQSSRVLSSCVLAFMIFSVVYCALDVPAMIEETSDDPYKICNDYSLFGLGGDKDWLKYKVAIEDDDIDKQQYYMYKLSQKYHPVNCPVTCRPNCAYTFSQLLNISEVLIKEQEA